MAMFRANCGHPGCGANWASIFIRNGSRHASKNSEAYVVGFCPHCNGSIMAHIESRYPNDTDFEELLQITHDIDNECWHMITVWPETPKPTHPEHIPDGAARAFLQAERNRNMRDMEEAAAGSYRRALDIATKSVEPAPKLKLYQRIEKLADDGKLTPELKDWAHEIRDIGNDGAHEDGAVTKADVENIRTLTELVLTYLFTLPAQLELRRDRKETAAKDASASEPAILGGT